VSRALVTGGCGFIGSHLARRLLADGWEVDLLDDFSRGAHDADLRALLETPGVRLVERDLREPGALDGLGPYALVFHLAAILGVANVLERPYETLRDNTALLVSVLEWARGQATPPRLVFTSTSEVYAGTLDQGNLPVPTPEDVPIVVPPRERPRTSYMLSKLYGEALCLSAGVPVTIVRPHNFYGPRMGMSHVIPELLGRAHAAPEGGTLEVYSVEHRRTFCYIDDAVELVLRAALSPEGEGRVLNAGAEEPEWAIGAVAELVCRAVGKRLAIVPLPATPGSPIRRAPDLTEMRALTGYTPAVGLEDGIRRTYDWYRANVFSDDVPLAPLGSAGGER
jgi:nucleoside-diphosphate-sugar epimerase